MAHTRECPNCGAVLRLTGDKMKIVCEYCGFEFETGYQSSSDMAAQAERMAYARRRGELRAQEEVKGRRNARVALGCFAAIAVFLAVVFVIVLLVGILSGGSGQEVVETGFAGMDERTMKRVHEHTVSVITNNMAAIPKRDYKLEEETMYLLVAEDTEEKTNYLYDVYKGDVTRSDGTHMTVYLAVYYKNFHSEGNGEYTSDFIMWEGHYLSAGDYSQLFSAYESLEDLEAAFAENERTAGMTVEAYK